MRPAVGRQPWVDLPGAGPVLAIGANADCLGHFVARFLAGGGAAARLRVVRDAAACPRSLCVGVAEVAIDAADPQALAGAIAGLVDPVGCVFSWHHHIAAAVIDVFGGRLFNLHGGDLPRYRGAGGGSWQVLNGEGSIQASIHRMTRAMDRGELLMSEREDFGTAEPYPADVKAAAGRASRRVIDRLATAVLAGGSHALEPQDEGRALYFPRLDTPAQGWLDFSWSVDEVLRFVRAFSDPYPGATFRHGQHRYRVRRASLRNPEALHPFCAGLVVNRLADEVHVALRDGVVALSGIDGEDGQPADLRRFRVGDRFWTAAADLQAARCFRPGVGG